MQEKQSSQKKASFDQNVARQYFNAAGIAGTDPRKNIDSRGGSSKRRNIQQLLNRDDLSEIDAQSEARSMSYTKPGALQ